jgi:hypothetical protein
MIPLLFHNKLHVQLRSTRHSANMYVYLAEPPTARAPSPSILCSLQPARWLGGWLVNEMP